MTALTQQQLDHIEKNSAKSPRTLARELKLDVERVEDALAGLRARTGGDRFERMLLWLAPLIIIVVGALAYSNNFDDGWHFDDQHAVLRNEAIKEPSLAAIASYNLYRQVLYWTFAFSWKMHGDVPAGWHIENNLIHVANGLLVYALALLTFRALGRRGPRWPRLTAAIAGTIFVAHPLATQAVTYVTQRTESLCGTFMLLSLVLWARARVERLEGRLGGARPWLAGVPFGLGAIVGIAGLQWSVDVTGAASAARFEGAAALALVVVAGGLGFLHVRKQTDLRETLLIGGSVACAALGMATKEIAGMLPLIVMLWEGLFANGAGAPEVPALPGWLRRLPRLAYVIPWAAIFLALIPLMLRVGLANKFLPESDDKYEPNMARGSFEYLRTELNVLCTYVRLFFLPYGQTIDWNYQRVESLFSGPTLLSLAALVGAVGAALGAVRRAPVLAFGIISSLLIISLTSSIFILPDYLFEHRVYVALAPAAMVAACALAKLAEQLERSRGSGRRALAIVASAIVVVFAALTFSRNRVWANDETLWNDAVAKTGDAKARPWVNLGLYFTNNPDTQRVTLVDGTVLEGAVRQLPSQPDFLFVVPTRLDKNGVRREPVKVLVSQVRPGGLEPAGLIRAEQCYRRALEISPRYYKAMNNLAIAEVVLADRTRRDLTGATEAAKRTTEAREREAWAQAIKKLDADIVLRRDEAERLFLELIQMRPNDNTLHSNLGNLYLTPGYGREKWADAERELRISLKLKEEWVVHGPLAELLFQHSLIETDPAQRLPILRDSESHYLTYIGGAGPSTPPYVRERLKLVQDAIEHGGQFRENMVVPEPAGR
jgi:tetratricopeptide (TPR) repeat protein